MNYKLLFHTVRYLRPKQIGYQVWRKVHRTNYCALVAPKHEVPQLKTAPIEKPECYKNGVFIFLNLSNEFTNWNEDKYGALWTNNQCYFDWLGASTCSAIVGAKWIDRFIEDFDSIKQGRGSYSTALRIMNWVKFFCKYFECISENRENSLYSQLKFLESNIEWQTMGNHVLEDVYALFIGACYFEDKKLLKKASKRLLSQLEEQVLPDGAHYEQSPMYHCILLDRLLDCINIVESLEFRVERQSLVDSLKSFASRMLGHLESIVWSDGSIPMLNDSANGIAPTVGQIFDYAGRLGIKWEAIPMKECGYRKMECERMEAIVDVGNVSASYQPGHTHADSLNYELRIEGKPFVVDTGISTYNKNERRQLERSSVAHNVVVVDGNNSTEVWGGFRVGKRAKVFLDHELPRIDYEFPLIISAVHDGYNKPVKRRFEMSDGVFVVEDWYEGEAVSYIHIAEGNDGFKVQSSRFKFDGAISVDEKPWEYSTEYNRFHHGKVLEVKFLGYLKTLINVN